MWSRFLKVNLIIALVSISLCTIVSAHCENEGECHEWASACSMSASYFYLASEVDKVSPGYTVLSMPSLAGPYNLYAMDNSSQGMSFGKLWKVNDVVVPGYNDNWITDTIAVLGHDVPGCGCGGVGGFYLGPKITSYNSTIYTYKTLALIYGLVGVNAHLKVEKTPIAGGDTAYHYYMELFDLVRPIDDWHFQEVVTGQGIPSVQIVKDLGTSGVSPYFSYEPYLNWVPDFTFYQYVESLNFDKYYLKFDYGPPECSQWSQIPSYWIVPFCDGFDRWKFLLAYRDYTGVIKTLSPYLQVYWQLYDNPQSEVIPSALLLSSEGVIRFDKSLLESSPYDRWYVTATYQGVTYTYNIMQSDPPCGGMAGSGLGSSGKETGTTKKGLGSVGKGLGGYEKIYR